MENLTQEEKFYVDELDEEKDGLSGFGVFDIDTGKCYATFCGEAEAEENCKERNEEFHNPNNL